MSASAGVLFTWVGLLALAVLEFGASFLPLPREARPLILLPAVLMLALVATKFMRLRSGPGLVRVFVAAALLWLGILLILGSLDPLTRQDVFLH